MIVVRRVCSLFVLGLSVALFAAGCHKNVPQQAAAPPPLSSAATASTNPSAPPSPPPPAPSSASVPSASGLSEDDLFARKSVDQLNAERPLDDVFFDLDKSEIRNEGKAPLQKDAEWLKKWTSTRITVEGHCDSRGSSEYNLALGSRRADAVKSYLASLGVAENRITVVSKGKEQPFCTDENESCWQQNRRGHFLITAK
jgi:peptidoglycan-associated lipoprotein